MRDDKPRSSGSDNGETGVELDELRFELEGAADDLGRLTEQLRERTQVVERLEVLVAEVLGLVSVPVVVFDAEGRIAALSQGAIDDHPGLSEGVLGEHASTALPDELVRDIMAVSRAATPSHANATGSAGGEPEGGAARWVTVSNARVVLLPDGWAFAVLSR